MKRIYLATPYSHKDPAVRQARFEAVTKAAGELIAQDHHVFSPITHSHPIALAHPDMPTHYEYWREFNEWMIANSEALVVYEIDGWRESVGVAAEIAYAERSRKRVGWFMVWGGGIIWDHKIRCPASSGYAKYECNCDLERWEAGNEKNDIG